MRALSLFAVTLITANVLPSLARAEDPPPASALAQSSNDAAAVAAFRRGTRMYDHHDFHGALDAFRESYRLVPSPNSRLYLARALRELGQIPEAVTEFQGTLADATQRAATEARYAATRDAAHDELQPLLARVGRITLQDVPSGAHVSVDGHDVAPDALNAPVVVAVGNSTVSVETPGREPFHTTVAVTGGAELTVRVPGATAAAAPAVAPATTATGPAEHATFDRTFLYASIAAFGVGIVGFALEGTFWGLADSQYNQLVNTCGGPVTCPGHDSQISTGSMYDTLSYVGLAVGIVGVAAGGTLLYMSMRRGSSSHASARHPMQFGFTGTSLMLRGEF